MKSWLHRLEFVPDGSDGISTICATSKVSGSSFRFIFVVWTQYRQTFTFQDLWYHLIADKLSAC